MQLTYKFRISDTAASELNRQSRAVNYVWNYCNDVQKQALKWGKKWRQARDKAALYGFRGYAITSVKEV